MEIVFLLLWMKRVKCTENYRSFLEVSYIYIQALKVDSQSLWKEPEAIILEAVEIMPLLKNVLSLKGKH